MSRAAVVLRSALALLALALPLAARAAPLTPKKVPICKLVAAMSATTCAPKFVTETLLPSLLPLKISGIHFEKNKVDRTHKAGVQKLQKFLAAGFKWLGPIEKRLLPDRVDHDFDIDVALDKFELTPVGAGFGEFKLRAHVAADVKITKVVTNDGEQEFKDKKYRALADLGGTVYLTFVPGAADCTDQPLDWSMLVMNVVIEDLENLEIDGPKRQHKVPRWLTDSKKFLRIVNWGISRGFDDYDALHTRGMGLCLTKGADGKANCPGARPEEQTENDPSEHLVITAGLNGANLKVALGNLKGAGVASTAPLCVMTTSLLGNACLAPVFNAVSALFLPMRQAVPKTVVGIDGVEAIAQSMQLSTTAAGAGLAAKIGLGKQGETDFMLDASGTIGVTPHCENGSFELTLEPQLTKLGSDPVLPKWLLDGVGKTAINGKLAGLGPVVVPLKPRQVKELEREISSCAVTKALLKTSATDAVADLVARSLLPLELKAGQVMGKAAGTAVATAASDLSLRVTSVDAESAGAKAQKLKVSVELHKEQQAEALTAQATLTVGTSVECGPGKDTLTLTPHLDDLQAGKLPGWLLGSTVLGLVNGALHDPKTACIIGECKAR